MRLPTLPLTYANVMATIAVFVSLGGTSYAALVVTGANIKDGSLTGTDVRNSSLTGTDLRNGSIGLLDIADTAEAALRGRVGDAGPPGAAGSTGAAGAKGDTGPIGPRGIQGETGSQGAPGTPGAPGTSDTLTATGPEYTPGLDTTGFNTVQLVVPAGRWLITGRASIRVQSAYSRSSATCDIRGNGAEGHQTFTGDLTAGESETVTDTLAATFTGPVTVSYRCRFLEYGSTGFVEWPRLVATRVSTVNGL